jgi:peptidoglycan/LPS O-acetylase OafA/YrhL
MSLGVVNTNNKKEVPLIFLLRSMAVICVLLFHAGISSFVNGWIGVDIFLVISGYLMQKLYAAQLIRGNVNNFYQRRIARLIPTFLIVQLVVFVVFMLISLPFERALIARQFLWGFLGLSNVYYWTTNSYFSSDILSPSLNFWSLALELQFYLIFPILCILNQKKRLRLFVMVGLFAILSYLIGHVSPTTSFYLLPARVWEFLAGALFFEVSQYPFKNTYVGILRSRPLGYFLLASMSTFIITIRTSQFNLQMLVVSILGLLLIFQVDLKFTSSIVQQPIKWISDYSYEIYLWHLPIFVFFSYQQFHGNLNRGLATRKVILLILFTLIISFLTKRILENIRLRINVMQLVTALLCLSGLVSIVNILPLSSLSFGYSRAEFNIQNALNDRGDFRCGLLFRLTFLHSREESCRVGNNFPGAPVYLLVGNSHADAIKESLGNALNKAGSNLRLMQENDPLTKDNLKTYLDGVKRLKPNRVIMHNRLMSADTSTVTIYAQSLKGQNIPFYIILPSPDLSINVPEYLFKQVAAGSILQGTSLTTLADYRKVAKDELSYYRELETQGLASLIGTAEMFCTPRCRIFDHETKKPYFFDDNHLTKTGAMVLEPVFISEFSNSNQLND